MRPTVQDISEAEQALDLADEIIANIKFQIGIAKKYATDLEQQLGIASAKRYELFELVHVLRSRRSDSTPREHYASLAAESAEVGK